MFIVDWIILGCVIVSLVVLIFLIVRIIPKVRLIDLDAMPRAKLRFQKYRLLEERLERKTSIIHEAARRRWNPIIQSWIERAREQYVRLVALERKYRHAMHVTPRTKEEREQRRQKVALLLEEGAKLRCDGNYGEAEERLLEVIRLSPREIAAYEELGQMYLEKKDYDHALETLQFARKLNPMKESIYACIGLVYEQKGEPIKALVQYQKCMQLGPNNPRNLDLVLQSAIVLKKKGLAIKVLTQLKEVNPENQKIVDFENAIKLL